MFSGRIQIFDSNNPFEDGGCIGIFGGDGYDTWTIDQVDSLHQRNVLPDLGFSRDRSDGTDFLLLNGVDNARFTNVGVTDESN